MCARLTCEVSQRRDSACFLGPDIGHNFGQGRVFRVRTKPSKQPRGLVARGVPIEKVRAKRAMHSDWARGVAGAWSRRHREAAPGEVQLQTRP